MARKRGSGWHGAAAHSVGAGKKKGERGRGRRPGGPAGLLGRLGVNGPDGQWAGEGKMN
jgi:hypothetical protein